MKNHFGIGFSKFECGMWSFGMDLGHMHGELFLTIYIFKLIVTIGKFYH